MNKPGCYVTTYSFNNEKPKIRKTSVVKKICVANLLRQVIIKFKRKAG